MEFNFWLEIATIIILLVLVIDEFTKKQLYRLDTRYFMGALGMQILLSGVNILSSICLQHLDTVPMAVNVGLCVLYFCLQSTVILFSHLLLLTYANTNFSEFKPYLITLAVLFGSNTLLSISSIWTKAYFYIDRVTGYHVGKYQFISFFVFLFGMLGILIFMIRHHHFFLRQEKHAVFLAIMLLTIAVILQNTLLRNVQILGFATTVCLLFCHLSLENPNCYIDKSTGCNNTEALTLLMGDWQPNRDRKNIMILSIKNLAEYQSQLGYDDYKELYRQVVRFSRRELSNTKRVFRLEDASIVFVLEDDDESVTEYETRIDFRFFKPWVLHDGTRIELDHNLVVCKYPDQFNSFASFVDLKDYLNKQLKKNNTTGTLYADNELLERKRRQIAVENALQRAIANETLQVYYQPIYDEKTRTITALEALSRLVDDELGFVAPDEFIRVAEESGLILNLGKLVMKKSCIFIRDKLLVMENRTVRTVEINLSPKQLMHRETISTFRKYMEDFDIPPEMINFEITESATADSPDYVHSQMNQLVDYGNHFSLDDYGTGYSNISYLVKFPFEYIKFDKELVWSYFKDKSAHAVMQREFELIHELGKEIIAEGIEKYEYIEELRKHNVRFFQGYHFSKALPEDECIAFLTNPTPREMFA